MFFLEPPEKFNPAFETVGCFCEFDNKILLLLRQDDKPQGNTWGMPAGKIKERDKSLAHAMQREFLEETGNIVLPQFFIYFNMIYVRYPDVDFLYHTFHLILNRQIGVKIDQREHKAFDWFYPEQALTIPLIPVLPELIRYFYKI